MRSPMQRKYAAEAAHGARGEQRKISFVLVVLKNLEGYAPKIPRHSISI